MRLLTVVLPPKVTVAPFPVRRGSVVPTERGSDGRRAGKRVPIDASGSVPAIGRSRDDPNAIDIMFP